MADLPAGNATSETSPEPDSAAVIEKAMREIQARALANVEAQDEETRQKIQQLLDTLRLLHDGLYAAFNNPRPRVD
jgi:predicted  nucleic acid-binding Zn-ribbon protein